jgi:hypothetical protein
VQENAYNFSIFIFVKDVQRRTQSTTQDTRILRDDCQPSTEICKPNLRDVDVVDENAPLSRLHESEERQCEGTLPGPRSPKDAELLARTNFEVQVMENVWEFRLLWWVKMSKTAVA